MLKMDIIYAIVNGANSVEKVKRKTYASMGRGVARNK
jgi:NAD(P)H-nitrite reductase large subunit